MRRWLLLLGLFSASAVPAQNHPELEWQVLETEHFRVLFHQGLEKAAARAAAIGEQVYGPVTLLYGYEPGGKVRLLLRDYDDYANGATYYYQDLIEIWGTSLDHDYDLRGTSDWLRNVITHEFIHLISLGAARKAPQRIPALYLQYFGYQQEKDRPDVLTGYPDVLASYPVVSTVVPMWFAEGVSQYQVDAARNDHWDTHRDMILRTAVLEGTLLSFEEMGVFEKQGFGNEFVYDHGYGLVRYIAARYGDAKLAELCTAMSAWTTLDFGRACAQVLGTSAVDLYRDWREDMRVRYEAQVRALGERREGEMVSDQGFSSTRPAYSPDGKQLAYLSTRERHYGPHGLVLRQVDSGKEEVLLAGVVSGVSWSPDGQRLLFVRREKADKYGSEQADLYEWDLQKERRGVASRALWLMPGLVSDWGPQPKPLRRLTRGARALYPAYSPDGRWIAFVHNQGTHNQLGVMRSDGTGVRYLTATGDSTLYYTPQWTPDGRALAFSFSRGDQRDIGMVRVDLPSPAEQAELPPSAAQQAELPTSAAQQAALPASSALTPAGHMDLLVATPGTERDLPSPAEPAAFLESPVETPAERADLLVATPDTDRGPPPPVQRAALLASPAGSPAGHVDLLLATPDTDRGPPPPVQQAALLASPAGFPAGHVHLLVATPGTDRDPVWSADGRELVFASDVTGIYNLYSLELGTGEVHQVTNLAGGGFSPTLSPDGQVAFAAYGKKGYQIRQVARQGAPRADGSFVLAEPVRAFTGAPAVAGPEPRPYGGDLLKTSVLPRLLVDEGRFKAGLYVSAGDAVGRQSIFAGGALAPTNGDRDLFAMYEYRRWRPTVALEFFHQKRHSARGDSTEARDLIVTGVDYDLNQLVLAVRGRAGDHGQLEVSATYDRYDASVLSDAFAPRQDGRPGFDRLSQKPFGYTYLNGFGLGLKYSFESVARRRDREINPRSGRRLSARYDRMFNYFIKGFDQNSSFLQEEYLHLFYDQFTMDWNEYLGLPWSGTLGLRFSGGWIASDAVDDQNLVHNFFDYHLGGLPYMKGYSFYSLEGRKAAMAGASLRFPLLPDIGRRFLHLYLDKAYGAVYGDVGKAWDAYWDQPDPLTGRRGPRRDLGGQLRLDLVSYYSMPTRVQMDVAYGADEVRGRSPWKYYLTVLFGYM